VSTSTLAKTVTFDNTGASISMLSVLTGKTRKTVGDRLVGLEAVGTLSNQKRYATKDALKLIYAADYKVGKDNSGDYQPKTPADYKAHFEAEIKSLEFDERTGELINKETHYDELTNAFKLVVSNLDNLADRLEAEAGLKPEQKNLVDNMVRDMRMKLYESIVDEES